MTEHFSPPLKYRAVHTYNGRNYQVSDWYATPDEASDAAPNADAVLAVRNWQECIDYNATRGLEAWEVKS